MVRGNHQSARLIPACAGKTFLSLRGETDGGAHPRVCGENTRARLRILLLQGSSPRVRGKRAITVYPPFSRGLIPACAGKTKMLNRTSLTLWAHPRVCGENWAFLLLPLRMFGSSPRVRGKPRRTSYLPHLQGLIPACAGKTSTRRESALARRAHPRVCGENTGCRGRRVIVPGSSPRVRGKLCRGSFHRRPCRLIPACAGKTILADLSHRRIGAHPRVCGENAST